MEPILLDASSEPAKVVYVGDTSGTLAAGQSLKIETFPLGDEILDVEVPVGKIWSVRVYVVMEETVV